MRRATLIVAAFAGSTFAHAALAADMPVKALAREYAPPREYTWTGFYGGGNVGYGIGSNSMLASTTQTTPLPATNFFSQGGDLGTKGLIFGGQLGYNWQMQQWLFGIEADLQSSGIKGSMGQTSTVGGVSFNSAVEEKLKWFGTVRGRFGYVTQGWHLWYMTGGLAYGHAQLNVATSSVVGLGSGSGAGTVDANKIGYTFGGGVETRLDVAGKWTAKLEYLYVDLGNISGNTQTFVPGIGGTPNFNFSTQSSVDIREHVVRVGLNYHF